MVIRLNKGDLIDILASGSFIDEEDNLKKGIEILKNWGLEINENKSLSKRFGYFAGDDLTRFKELENAQKSKLIIFAKRRLGFSKTIRKRTFLAKWFNAWILGYMFFIAI